MKTTIYYFSGTGNTLYAAQRLAEELGDTELISISSAMKSKEIQAPSEAVGILFPVYCFGTPLIIKEFLKKLNVPSTSYLFGCVTYGGLLSASVKLFRKECKAQGLALKAGFALQMPGNAITTYDRLPEDKIKTFAEVVEQRIPEIADKIKQRANHKMETRQLFFQPLLSLLHSVLIYKMPEGAKKFHTTDSCKKCGQCIEICPVGNVSIENDTVLWGEKCEQCMACIQWCGQEAIQYDTVTTERKRYQHCGISREEIAVQGK